MIAPCVPTAVVCEIAATQPNYSVGASARVQSKSCSPRSARTAPGAVTAPASRYCTKRAMLKKEGAKSGVLWLEPRVGHAICAR
eukprot:1824640-Pleurochrysis_carterae.AAC.1